MYHFSGQTDGNRHFRVQGHTDTPLNEAGQNQADLVAEALGEIEFHQVYSSDLSRAKETCQRILTANVKSTTEIIESVLLREKNFGEAEDLHYLQFAYLTIIKNQSLPMRYLPKDGEGKEHMQNRAREFIQVQTLFPSLG